MIGFIIQNNYEGNALIEAANRAGQESIVLDPFKISYIIEEGINTITIYHDGLNISSMTGLVVRSTRNKELAVSMLAHSLYENGCIVIDGVERFTTPTATKLISTIDRWKRQVGTNSYISFDIDGAMNFLPLLSYPAIGKQIAGAHSQNMVHLKNKNEAEDYIRSFFANRKNKKLPIFIQKFEDIEREYRVFVLHGQVLGMVQKIKKGKYSIGSNFRGCNHVDVRNFVAVKMKYGLIGMDVAVTTAGRWFIIEENYGPEWERFERAKSGVNIAESTIQFILDHSN